MLFAVCGKVANRTDKPSGSLFIRNTLQLLQYEIAAIFIGCLLSGKAMGINTRCTIQCINHQAAVIRQHGTVQGFLHSLRLYDGIFLKGCACFRNFCGKTSFFL